MPTRRMLLRGDDRKFDRCREYVNNMLQELVPMYDKIEANNLRAWEKSKATYDRRHQVWQERKGESTDQRAFEFKVGDRI